jgi:DNA-binding NtrC family response regulator
MQQTVVLKRGPPRQRGRTAFRERPAADPVPARSEAGALALRREIEPLWMVEKRAIETAIELCDGNINRAAGLLEVAPSTLYRKRQSMECAERRYKSLGPINVRPYQQFACRV